MNSKFIYRIVLSIIISLPLGLSAQEICDNAIDDDLDGLIDLNDPDCVCASELPSSLIPNPSFEDMTCCPETENELNCAVSWIQASAPTSDYVHTCGVLGNPFLGADKEAPLPIPDGEGAIGFRDGKSSNPQFKEYVGSCLLDNMQIGVEYTFDFFVGFPSAVSSREINLTFYGATNCQNLPFGGNDQSFGCPTNDPSYSNLGSIVVTGNYEWKNVSFSFIADREYEVLVMGPPCEVHPNTSQDPYFFLDRLILSESSLFVTPFIDIDGSICTDDLNLVLEAGNGETYQWYKDSIAIVGETSNTLVLTESPDVEGNYMAVITDGVGCFASETFELSIPSYSSIEEISICQGEFHVFNGDSLNTAGPYQMMLTAQDGCDSIADLELTVLEHSEAFIQDTICSGDVFEYLDIITTEAGSYESVISNAVGCDSSIMVDLTVVQGDAGIDIDDEIELMLGDTIDLYPIFFDPNYISFTWYTEDGVELSDSFVLANYQAIFDETIYVRGEIENGCFSIDSINIRVDDSNAQIYVPNIFSPNGDFKNDFFRFYPSIAVDRVLAFELYDRWGNLVFKDSNITRFRNYVGWDGIYRDQEAENGVYAYVVHALYLNGEEEVLGGDFTLIR